MAGQLKTEQGGDNMKKFFAVLAALCLLLSVIGVHAEAAEPQEAPLSVTLDVLNRGADAFYGCDVNISIKDFIALGFELGDACNVVLENELYRYEFKSVPFYNGYYTKTGDPLLCGYGYAIKENRGDDYQYTRTDYPYLRFCYNNREMWNLLHLTTDMKCTITLVEQGGYEYEQKLVGGLTYSKNFEDYEAKNGISKEEVFANFRAVRSEAMKENVLFRSASPFDNANNRAPYVNELAKANGIDYVLNLADSQKKIDKYKEAEVWSQLDYSQKLLDNDQVCLMAMSAAYEGAAYQSALVRGLNSALEHNATKILFHCTEGKDRTGFVGVVLESLCGATYEEMLNDYMVTYDNYYSLTEESDKTAYDYIVELKFNDMINYLLTFDSSLEAKGDGTYDLAAVTPENYATAARNLLSKAGMSNDNLEALTALLKK
jgi:hypothetical protein